MIKTVLVTGGAGYIGSHICVELLDDDYEVIVVDNLSNSSEESLNRVEQITGKSLTFYQMDVCNEQDLTTVFKAHHIDAVIHLAGLKAVGESCEKPLLYYQNNLMASLTLFEVMQDFNVNNLVFSSSATVYGDPATVPITEDFPLSTTNPYGRTKLMIEEMLMDLVAASTDLNVVTLRYFNPVGAHESGLIGEDPNGIPNNLLPYIAQVAIGKLAKVSVFGGDYATKDGTGVRDYIHVVDLAKGHLKALQAMTNPKNKASEHYRAYNLGTGCGYSVLEMIDAFKQVSAKEIPYQIVARRSGDIAECYAEAILANQQLDWIAQKTLVDMVTDSWRWQTANPDGYHTTTSS